VLRRSDAHQLMLRIDPAKLQASGTLPAAVAQARDAVWAEANVTIDDLKAQLAATRSAERQQAEAHERAEEDMRRSFMRSVCTLNIEVRPAEATLTGAAAETPLTICNAHLTGIRPQHSVRAFMPCHAHSKSTSAGGPAGYGHHAARRSQGRWPVNKRQSTKDGTHSECRCPDGR